VIRQFDLVDNLCKSRVVFQTIQRKTIMAITVLAKKPSILRYLVKSADGSALYRDQSQMLADMGEGPLKSTLAAMTASWGDGETPTAANPMGNSRITTIVTPLTSGAGSIPTTAAVQYYNSSGLNLLEILGGALPGTVATTLTNCIVEIRYNHSLE
jgi:hypothetical protein